MYSILYPPPPERLGAGKVQLVTLCAKGLSEQEALDILKPYRTMVNSGIPPLLRAYVADSHFLPLLEEHFGVVGYEATISHSKRLRASLCMMVAESLGIDLDRILALACSLEFFHAASLIIDDIQDNSTERVGTKAIWTKIGKNDAINAGFYLKDTGHRLFCQGMSLFPVAGQHVYDHLHKVSQMIATGQSMDLRAPDHWNSGLTRYQEIARKKTGCLLGLGLCLPFLLIEELENADVLFEFGTHLGVIHQLNDDIDDLAEVLAGHSDTIPDSLDPGNVAFFLEAPSHANHHPFTAGKPKPYCHHDRLELIGKLHSTIEDLHEDLSTRCASLPLSHAMPFNNLLRLCSFLAERNTSLLQELSVRKGGEI